MPSVVPDALRFSDSITLHPGILDESCPVGSDGSEKPVRKVAAPRGRATAQLTADAVQQLFDGHTATSLCEPLGLSLPNLCPRSQQGWLCKVARLRPFPRNFGNSVKHSCTSRLVT